MPKSARTKGAGKRASAGDKKEKAPLWQWFTENIECLATAVVMALMLNQFIIQAYKIPTGSMQPTIMGDEQQGIFDRILVNKFLYFISDPERWDVFVFKYPLDQSQNYIKRLIGLPGEKVGIRDGDIYVNGKIERKPENATCAVLKQLFPPPGGEPYFASFFNTEGDCTSSMEDEAVFSGPGTIRTKAPIRCNYLDGYNVTYHIANKAGNFFHENLLVGDIRLTFQASLTGKEGGLRVELRESGRIHTLFLRGEKNSSYTCLRSGSAGGKDKKSPAVVWEDPDLYLEEGREYDIVFSHIDDRLAVRIDGEDVASFEYDVAINELKKSRSNSLAFGPEGCGAEFHEIKVYRDIYYLPGKNRTKPVEFDVPEGHYFAMGDNTQNSLDSRWWEARRFELKSGKVIEADETPYGKSATHNVPDGGGVETTDIYGDTLFIPDDELTEEYRHEVFTVETPFIPRSLVLGKAMVVFWPMFPHFRWKLLR